MKTINDHEHQFKKLLLKEFESIRNDTQQIKVLSLLVNIAAMLAKKLRIADVPLTSEDKYQRMFFVIREQEYLQASFNVFHVLANYNQQLSLADIMYNYYDDKHITPLRKALDEAIEKQPNTQQNLNFSGKAYDDKGMPDIVQISSLNSQICALDLSHNDIGDEEAKKVAQLICSCPSLRILNISHNKIGDRGTAALVDAITSKQSNLLSFNMSSNKPGKDGLQKLKELFTDSSLIALDVSGMPFSPKDYQDISEFMENGLKTLRSLSIGYVKPVPRTPRQMEKRDPHLNFSGPTIENKASANESQPEIQRLFNAVKKTNLSRFNYRGDVPASHTRTIVQLYASTPESLSQLCIQKLELSNNNLSSLIKAMQSSSQLHLFQIDYFQHVSYEDNLNYEMYKDKKEAFKKAHYMARKIFNIQVRTPWAFYYNSFEKFLEKASLKEIDEFVALCEIHSHKVINKNIQEQIDIKRQWTEILDQNDIPSYKSANCLDYNKWLKYNVKWRKAFFQLTEKLLRISNKNNYKTLDELIVNYAFYLNGQLPAKLKKNEITGVFPALEVKWSDSHGNVTEGHEWLVVEFKGMKKEQLKPIKKAYSKHYSCKITIEDNICFYKINPSFLQFNLFQFCIQILPDLKSFSLGHSPKKINKNGFFEKNISKHKNVPVEDKVVRPWVDSIF